jgi:hypothetical protein
MRDDFRTQMHEVGSQQTTLRYTARAQERLLPLASLSLGSVLTGIYSAFSNPVLERFGYGMANMRLISYRAG